MIQSLQGARIGSHMPYQHKIDQYNNWIQNPSLELLELDSFTIISEIVS